MGLPVGVGGFAEGGISCDATFGKDGSVDTGALATILLKSLPFLPGDGSFTLVVDGGATGAAVAADAGVGGADMRDKSLPLPAEEPDGLGASAEAGAGG